MDRLARKFETARSFVPRPEVIHRQVEDRHHRLRHSHWAIIESRDQLREENDIETGYLRLRAYPFTREVHDFVKPHERVYVVEQNRDAQMLGLLKLDMEPALMTRLRSVATFTACRSTRAPSPTKSCPGGQVTWRPRHTHPVQPAAEDQPHRPELARLQGRQDHAVRRLRPQRDFRAHHRSLVRDGRRTPARGQAHRHRLLVQEPGVFPEQLARLQRRARPHAVGGTGAMLANRKLIAIGVSGDGDTASIGIGQFVHLMRRNLPIIYIIEDNGCYGLTKGQFSATADLGSKLKTGVVNDLPPIDTCALAIKLGATFVARSFSGDKRQLHGMFKAAIAHNGTVDARRHFALRHLQRPRRLDQVLQVREGPRRAGRGSQLRARRSRTSRWTTTPARPSK